MCRQVCVVEISDPRTMEALVMSLHSHMQALRPLIAVRSPTSVHVSASSADVGAIIRRVAAGVSSGVHVGVCEATSLSRDIQLVLARHSFNSHV